MRRAVALPSLHEHQLSPGQCILTSLAQIGGALLNEEVLMGQENETGMTIYLDRMSPDELKALQIKVEEAIKAAEAERKKAALAAAQAAAREMGFSLEELTATRKTLSAPKYRHPEKPTQTWSGRGRRPKWFKDALARGRDEASMRIK